MGHAVTFRRGGADSIPDQSMRDLFLTNWHWDRFFQVRLSPSHYHSKDILCSFLSYYYFSQKDERPKPGNLSKSTALLEVGYQWKNKQSTFALLLVFKGLSFTEKEMLM